MKKRKEEILELAWTSIEKGNFTRNDIARSTDEYISLESLDELLKEKYLKEDGDGITFTPEGMREARRIIRAHRLSERLFTDVLDLPLQSGEPNACTFEHFLSPEVVDSICTLLGHPRECPHGRSIPRGACCETAQREVKSIIIPLSELKSGNEGKVVYVVTKPARPGDPSDWHHQRLDQLTAFGIIPGALVRVHQTAPAYVVKIGSTDLALDKDIVKDIYVRFTQKAVC